MTSNLNSKNRVNLEKLDEDNFQNNKCIRIFDYGTLLDNKVLMKIYNDIDKKNIKLVKLYGFLRIFNGKSLKKYSKNNLNIVSLNIEKSEINHCINGICFEISPELFQKLIDKYSEFELISIEICDFYNDNNKFKAYTFRYPHYEVESGFIFDSKEQLEYLDNYFKFYEEYGIKFLNYFKKTTLIGRKTLNELKY